MLTHKDGFSWNWNIVRAVLKVILEYYSHGNSIAAEFSMEMTRKEVKEYGLYRDATN